MRRRSARIRKATTGVATAGLLLGVVTVAAGGPAKADDPAALLDGIAAGVLPDMDHLEDTARFPLDAASIPKAIEAWKTSPAGQAALAAGGLGMVTAQSLPYDVMAERIAATGKLSKGERVLLRVHKETMPDLAPVVQKRLERDGAIVEIPVFLSDTTRAVPIEIQIRTVAMDFWASVEHKIYYKYAKHVPAELLEELSAAARVAHELDTRMGELHRIVHG